MPVRALYFPAEQGMHAAPLGEAKYEPATHAEQLVRLALELDPTGQALQAVKPVVAAMKPGAHTTQLVDEVLFE